MARVTSVVDTIMAEAGGKTRVQRLRDMKAIASAMVNRARQLGVSLEDVVSVTSEFNAFGRRMPAGVEQYRDLAEQALTDVIENGPINNATFYATPATVDNLPSGLAKEDETAGHHFFSDPENRSIRTAQGFMQPSGTGLLAGNSLEQRTAAQPSAFDSLFGGYSANPQQGFSAARGLLSDEAAPSASTGLLGVTRTGYGSPFGQLGDRITSGFGYRQAPQTTKGAGSSRHQGIDLSLQGGASGYPAEAAAGGIVSFAGPSKGYGNLVELSHPDGSKTRYGHLSEIGNLAIGDQVARGTPVGLVGNTGRSRGAHLHFETIDPMGRAVDPRTVVDFNAASNVPTPVDRPADAWQDATPMAVERQDLPSVSTGLLATPTQQKIGYGLLANTMGQTPSLGLSGAGVGLGATGRMMDTADVAQNYAGARDALLGSTPTGRVSDQQMASMQDEANRSRQSMEMNQGLLSLSPSQMTTAMNRRENALGLLSSSTPSIGAVATASQPSTFGGVAATADLTTPASTPMSMPSNVSMAQNLTGVAPNMTQTVNAGLLSNMPDISAPVSGTEFTGFLSNPAVTNAQKFGLQPTQVQSTGLLSAVVDPVSIAGPVTAETISTPQRTTQRTARRAAQATTPTQGLLSQTEQGMVDRQKANLAKQGPNVGVALKNALGPLAGALAGGILAGPFGALLGGYVANQVATAPSGQGEDYFPGRPKGGVQGDGKLSDYGRGVAEGSRQFGNAVANGSKGLW